jgi:hypothetical protein
MSNANVIASLVSGTIQGTIAPLAVGASTAETAILMSVNPLTLGGGGGAVLVGAAEGNTPSFYAGGRPFKVQAWGTATTGASETLTLKLYQVPGAIVSAGTSATLANDHVVKASSARTIATSTAPFYVEGLFQYESVSQRLVGNVSFEINGLLDVAAASTIITGLLGDGDLNFILSATMGTGNAADVINLNEISISQV